MILLFQSYTGGRPAEFVYSSKNKASENPLGETKKTNKNKRPQERGDKHNSKSTNANNSLEYDNNSDTSNNLKYNNNLLFDFNDNKTANKNNLFDENISKSTDRNSSYNSDRTDIIITEDTDDCYPVEIDGARHRVQ
jgi:hypothetical protein